MAANKNIESPYLTTTEAASVLRVTPQAVRQMCQRGDLAHKRFGSVYRVLRSAVLPAHDDGAPFGSASVVAESRN